MNQISLITERAGFIVSHLTDELRGRIAVDRVDQATQPLERKGPT